MLLSTVTEAGQVRVYATRYNSIVTYFTEDETTGGIKLNMELGFCALPEDLVRVGPSVGEAVIAEIALRLGIPPAEVLQASLKALCEVADPELPAYYRWAPRSRGRAATCSGR
ncbi:MAG: hypothetical protein AB7E81_17745 [Hyphomicrobiaceae bacterium]|jgi:hypothetical protein